MPSYISRDQRGFTLIEMSIVLVIIGLIVGGILKGQEVIESARQKNLAAMYDQIRAAQNTFVDRYRSLPGDFAQATSKISAQVENGDNNGFVATAGGIAAASAAGIAAVNASQGEFYGYFQSLVASGLYGGGQIGNSSGASIFSGGATASPLPAAPWSNTGLTAASGTHEGVTSVPASAMSAVWLRLAATAGAISASSQGALTAASAFQVDQKFDDGVPGLGRIRNSGITTGVCGGPANPYTVTASTENRECDLFLAVD
jgi:prepilin-type N-terminal cleavage/methylation domain-containing protein